MTALLGRTIFISHVSPHILIGGETGSGKTVLFKVILLQMILQGDIVYIADFKGGVDFGYSWRESAHLITTEKAVLAVCEFLAGELEKRKELFCKEGAVNIEEYRSKTKDYLPRYVFACDELAALFTTKGATKERKELLAQIENYITLFATQGRAFGLTVILCAQRPDSDVLPGQIKSNMTVRICGRSNATLSTIIIGDGRASEQIPHNARGRFLMEDGTLFQGYYLNESSDS